MLTVCRAPVLATPGCGRPGPRRCRRGSPSGCRPRRRPRGWRRCQRPRPGWRGRSQSSTVRPPAGSAGRPATAVVAPTAPAGAAAGPPTPPTAPPETAGGSVLAPCHGSTMRTRTATGADPHRQPACTAGASAPRTTSAAGPAPAWPPARPDRPPDTSPAICTPSCDAFLALLRPPPDAPPPQPAPRPAAAKPRAWHGQACVHRHPAQQNHPTPPAESRPTYVLLSKFVTSTVDDGPVNVADAIVGGLSCQVEGAVVLR